MIKPIRRPSLADTIFAQLQESIINGDIQPGDELPGERVLSEQLEANRGVVREALKRLSQAGLVEIRHGEPTRILDYRSAATIDIIPQILRRRGGEVDLRVARSMIELRKVITPDMTRLAVLRGAPQQSAVLQNILEEMRQEEISDAEIQALTDQFWVVIAKNSENIAYRLILNTVTEVRRLSEGYLAHTLSIQYHDFSHLERIIAAIRAGDSMAAFEAARERSEAMAKGLLVKAPATG